MPWSYTIDKQRGIVFTVVSGVVSDENMLEHVHALSNDPEFRPDLCQLLDFRQASELEVTPQGIKKVIALNPWGAGSKRALVAPNETVFGMARMYELGRSNPTDEFRVFRSISEARAWLGLPSDHEES